MEQGQSEVENGTEVVQIIMQEDGQVIMPEQQFIQLNTTDDMQFIQVVSETGEKQLLQLGEDGQAHVIQLVGMNEETPMLQVTESLDIQAGQSDSINTHSELMQLQEITDGETSLDKLSDSGSQSMLITQLPEGREDGKSDGGDEAMDFTEEHMVVNMENICESSTGIAEQSGTDGTVISVNVLNKEQTINMSDIPVITVAASQASSISQRILITSVENEVKKEFTSDAEAPKITLATPAAVEKVMVTSTITANEKTKSAHQMSLGKGGTVTCIQTPFQHIQPQVLTSSVKAIKKENTPTPQDQPIELTSETVVTVGGKKCVLRVDADTGQLKAYPFKPPPVPGKRPRGRPRKVETDKTNEAKKPVVDENEALANRLVSEQENSAAEGLLGLSDTGGRRKSMRAKKKKVPTATLR